jgi:Zn-finger nucleic acid-binding protein
MQCPVDGTQLMIAERAGVEIDYCPQCRGVWLDRGELDKIIDRSAPEAAPVRQGGRDEAPRRKKRGGGFLEELFDF